MATARTETPASSYLSRLCVGPLRGLRNHQSRGLERLVLYTLVLLRPFSVTYLLLSVFPDGTNEERTTRDNVVDALVVTQCLLVGLLLWLTPTGKLALASAIAGYLLPCLYLSLINIVFLSDISTVNMPTTSARRSLLLLAINVLQVAFTFAILYSHFLQVDRWRALFGSFLVLGTLGLPDGAADKYSALVPAQVASNLVLFALVIAVFVSQIQLRFAGRDSGDTNTFSTKTGST